MPARARSPDGHAPEGPPPPAVSFDGITKRFGAVTANRGVRFDIAAGSIHGVIGENGAGKSTLMSILYGFYQADEGTIRLNGRPARLANSRQAIAQGIGMVHQHFVLIEPFSVTENIMLGVEDGLRLGPARAAARARLETLAGAYGLGLDMEAVVEDLPVGLRQRVEILKALYRGAEILILDEPTAVLTPEETDQLFVVLKRLASEGKTILLITHKLREIMAVTDRVTVMRAGQVVAERDTAATSPAELAELMVGRKPVPAEIAPPPADAPVVLSARGLRVVDASGRTRLDGIDLDLRAGEVVGVAGVAGNGQTELLEALAGMIPAAGELRIEGTLIPAQGRARALRQAGLAHIPEDRLRTGLVKDFEAWETAILGGQHLPARASRGFLRIPSIRSETRARMADYEVRPPDVRLRSALFSGGNQQKLICAREMTAGPRVLLVGQPTRGVDIGAIELIHHRLVALKRQGAAILLVSVELDEILALSDRIIVLAEGRIAGTLPRAAASERAIGLMMAGLSHHEGEPAPAGHARP